VEKLKSGKLEKQVESATRTFHFLLPLFHFSTFPLFHFYLVSLCAVCLRQKRQYLLNSIRSVVFFLFFVVL
jgi:hypothetical protein